MKTITFLLVGCMLSCVHASAQVGVNTTGNAPDGSAGLDVNFQDKGFLMPRVSNPLLIPNPAAGLQVYNLSTNCINIFNGTTWREICPTTIAGTISTLNCTPTHNGSLLVGQAATGNSVTSVFSYAGGNGFPYNSFSVTSTGVVGLTATISAGTFAIGSGTVTVTITGTPAYPGVADFAISIGGQTCTLSRAVGGVAYDGSNCGTGVVSFTYNGASVTYGTVVGANSSCWLDRNLGAQRRANSQTDHLAYGDLFQWGRLADGHQLITWTGSTAGTPVNGTTTTLSSSNTPANASFILALNNPFDWRSPQNNLLWQGVSGANNPCPSGWRIPNQTELNNELVTWSPQNASGAYASALKWVPAGTRNRQTGVLDQPGVAGGYWSSSVVATSYSVRTLFDSGSAILFQGDDRGRGASVRCIKN